MNQFLTNKVLIVGSSSFVSQGLADELHKKEKKIDYFSRGTEGRDGNYIKGNYLFISNNKYLNDAYDVVINYAVIKDGSIESNLQFIKSLLHLCKEKGVKKLIHFSSVMVYGYHEGYITEKTPIETIEETWKRGYGEFKIAVDQYLMSVKESLPFELVVVRPGYVLADNRPCPFIRPLLLGFAIIKGNSKSKQPIVKREEIHEALIKIIETKQNLPVYHFFPNDGMTKFRFARMQGYKHLIPMPKWLFRGIPLILMKIGIMSKPLYSRFDGMYNESVFSSEITEKKLGIRFS